jgi:hypothetical protein
MRQQLLSRSRNGVASTQKFWVRSAMASSMLCGCGLSHIERLLGTAFDLFMLHNPVLHRLGAQ